MTSKRAPAAPQGLQKAGAALWRGIVAVYELDPRELTVLGLACRQADDVARLEAAVAAEGVVVEGSKGQPRLSQVVGEVRQSRLALARLLGELALPDAEDRPATARSARAKRAADSRWDRVARIEERRRGAA